MTVLVEAISVVVRQQRLVDSYPGGWSAFVADYPNQALCADRDLARIGFMSPVDVEAFTHRLETSGLVFLSDGEAVDIAVVDQLHGPAVRCDWREMQYGLSPVDLPEARKAF